MPGVPLILPSFAKINLDLRVVSKRTDGYHDLSTVFQAVTLADKISFVKADRTSLTCSDPAIPTGGRNLILKAAECLRSRFSVGTGARIHLEKNIPSPGGLGGGSSNAAVALIGLCDLWDLHLDTDELHKIAAELGSDVPYFLYGGTALGTGRGTEIEPIDEFECETLVIVTPRIAVSTQKAFSGLEVDSLTKDEVNRILLNYRFWAGSVDFHSAVLQNDFEKTVFAAYPAIEKAKATLLECGAVKALLSGSGASVFGIFDKQETRQTAMKALGNVSNWRSFAVATISRKSYREALKLVS
jgi:4-diphosphocytidyl-2-C-methyl-D-erythritol kinase